MTLKAAPSFAVKLARTQDDLQAAKRLRYQVFVEELGGGGSLVDHENRLEQDRFDPFFDHLLLTDTANGDVVGVYRVMRSEQAERAGGFYSDSEYDLGPLLSSGRRLLELGRSCLHENYRGGTALYHLWSGLADYIVEHEIEVLFGVASFHGTDAKAIAAPLSLLHHRHLAPQELRVTARPESRQPMDLIAEDQLDRRAAMLQIPSLIKAYLRLGGFVGEGAFVDYGFNTTDVCLILDTERMNQKQARVYQGKSG
ncbi:MAG: GNAT family N-acyltransferase [Roseobacter sp.]|jgi:putative hemolysin|nr:GNAT family N-acyltransferase [Roseobacter sp.]